jgi:hypothetical protein
MKNINLGKNQELMEKCGILKEYATLVDKIKRYTKEMNDIEKAIDRAVEECIKEGVLADFLIGHRADLNRILLKNNRFDDLERSTNDKTYRKQLMSELLD